MRTYWLTGEDSAKRLARIKKDVINMFKDDLGTDSKSN